MSTLRQQFITDDHGKKIAVILSMKTYENMLEEIEELEDIGLYDDAKKEDDSKRVLLSDYLKKRKAKNA